MKSPQVTVRKALLFIIVAVGMVAILVPILWMLSTSFKERGEIWKYPPSFIPHPVTFDNYVAIFTRVPILLLLFNSALVAVAVTVAQLVTSCMAAFAFARINFRGRERIFLFFLATMMIPGYILIVPLFLIINALKMANSYWALILPSVVSAFSIFLLRQFFLGIPKEYVEAAYIDGSSRMSILWRIVVPMSTSAIAALVIFVFMGSWNNFFWPLVAITKQRFWTLPLGFAYFQHADNNTKLWGPIMALSVVATVPILALFLAAQKRFIEGLTMTGLKG
jgi:multiple sugar transport system permease protein